MNEIPRQKLIGLVARFGRELGDDARRCEALLHDMCGDQFKREVFLLLSAVRDRVPWELANASPDVPIAALLPRLSARLHENMGLEAVLARWSVESWALALGIMTPDDLSIDGAALDAVSAGDDPRRDYRATGGGASKNLPAAEDPAVAASAFRRAAQRAFANGITDQAQADLDALQAQLGIASGIANQILVEESARFAANQIFLKENARLEEQREQQAKARLEADLVEHRRASTRGKLPEFFENASEERVSVWRHAADKGDSRAQILVSGYESAMAALQRRRDEEQARLEAEEERQRVKEREQEEKERQRQEKNERKQAARARRAILRTKIIVVLSFLGCLGAIGLLGFAGFVCFGDFMNDTRGVAPVIVIAVLIVLFAILAFYLRNWWTRVCPGCRRWKAAVLRGSKLVERHNEMVTRRREVVQKDHRGRRVGSTTWDEQVQVTVDTHLNHMACKYCGHTWKTLTQSRSG